MALQYRINRPLLYQEVVNALYQIIDDQEIKPGDQLPSERELIEQMGVSRNVLREAFHVLEQRGIIISRPSEKIRYLMGVGTPVNILEAVFRGVDLFDCVMPSRNARHGHLFTWQGIRNLMNAKYEIGRASCRERV